jgi:hypothetical protein
MEKVIDAHGSADGTPLPSITDLLHVNTRDFPATHLDQLGASALHLSLSRPIRFGIMPVPGVQATVYQPDEGRHPSANGSDHKHIGQRHQK